MELIEGNGYNVFFNEVESNNLVDLSGKSTSIT